MGATLFISFEGGEGAGKTTQSRLLCRKLREAGQCATLVHEPGSTPLGEYLRSYLKSNNPLTAEAELLLFEAARVELVTRTIEPELLSGCHVIADRFEASTVAYQGYGRGLDLEVVDRLNRFATRARTPDITFLLDLDPAEGLRRVGSRQLSLALASKQSGFGPEDVPDTQPRFEEEAIEFHRRVRQGFMEQAHSNPARWTIIDASMSTGQVAAQVWDRINGSVAI